MQKSFHGVLAVGKDKDAAVTNYRLAKTGKNVVSLSSSTDHFAVSGDFHTMFNPTNGELDLTPVAMPEDTKFMSENSEEKLDANWMVCADGCGSHIIFEKESTSMKFCPVCASSLEEPVEQMETDETEAEEELPEEETEEEKDDTGEESESDEALEDPTEEENEKESDEEVDEDEEEDLENEDLEDPSKEATLSGVVIASSTRARATAMYRNAVKGKGVRAVVSENNRAYLTSVSESLSFDPEDGESLLSPVENFELTQEESASLSKEQAHYKVCSSEEGCGSHVVSSSEAHNCPVCSSKLQEPSLSEDDVEEDLEDPEEESTEDEDLENTDAPETTDEEDEDVLGEDKSEEPTDELSMNLLDDASESGNLSLSFANSFKDGKDAWLASISGVTVAYACRDTVGQNADLFDKQAFANAVISQSKSGVKEALTEMGFKPIVISASVNRKIEQEVDAKVADIKATVEAEAKQYQERFLAALSTAAIGINRGFFANAVNPLKAQLWKSLNTVGVSDAEVLIDNVFSTSSDLYHKALFDKAVEILSKSSDVQEELAKTVLGTNYQKVLSSSSLPPVQTGQLGQSVKSESANKGNSLPALLQNLKFNKY
jgi:hypothetical protein